MAKWNVVALDTGKPFARTPHTCVNMQLDKCGIKSCSFMQVQILPIFQNDVAGYQERIRGRFEPSAKFTHAGANPTLQGLLELCKKSPNLFAGEESL